MGYIDKLRESLQDGYWELYTNDVFQLTEDNKGAKCNCARFEKNGGRVLACKFDKAINVKKRHNNKTITEEIKSIFPFFKDVTGLAYMADYILFYEREDGRFYIVICNLKSGKTHNCDSQLKGAAIFSEFLVANIERVFEIGNSWDYARKIVFSEKLLYKTNWKDLKSPNKQSVNVHKNYISNDKTNEVCNLDAICN